MYILLCQFFRIKITGGYMAQELKYSANFKRNYISFFALALFFVMIVAEFTIALSIPHFVQREDAYAFEIRKREMLMLFDTTRTVCHDIKETSDTIKLEKKLLLDTLDYLAIYLRKESDRLTPEDVDRLSPQIVEMYKIAARLEKGESFSRESQLDSTAPYPLQHRPPP